MRKTLGRYVNAAAQTVAAGSNILFTNNTFSNSSFGYNGLGGIQLKTPGTYLIFGNFLNVATAAGDTVVTMYENGTAVPGAITGDTLADIDDYAPLGITAIVTVKPSTPDNYATITFTPATATSFNAVSVIIERVE